MCLQKIFCYSFISYSRILQSLLSYILSVLLENWLFLCLYTSVSFLHCLFLSFYYLLLFFLLYFCSILPLIYLFLHRFFFVSTISRIY